jgi:hypothetical protein
MGRIGAHTGRDNLVDDFSKHGEEIEKIRSEGLKKL